MATYDVSEIEEQMKELFEELDYNREHEQVPDFPDVEWAQTFDDYGVLTRNKGLVVKIGESVFDITIVKRK